MKNTNKMLAVILALTVVLSGIAFATLTTSAAGTVVNTIEYGKELKGGDDVYEMEFKDVAAGVYKIAYYMTVESVGDGKQMRISPRVNCGGKDYRCWIDWKTTDEMNGHAAVKTVMEDENTKKVILVSVINVPEGGATINAGYWQDKEAYIGTLDKVVLASSDYNFANDKDYALVDEKGYRGNDANTTYGGEKEDPEQKLLAEEDDFTASVKDAGDNTGDNTGDNNGDNNGDNAGDNNSDKPAKTGDVSAILAILTAGAAAFGGLKLRKR